jgi:preprotein translocase subunit SecA
MDYLREGIHLRGFAQMDPLVAYKNEGFTMFRELMNSIWEEFARAIFHVKVEFQPDQARETLGPAEQPRDVRYSGGDPLSQPSALYDAARGQAPAGDGAPRAGDGARARETVGSETATAAAAAAPGVSSTPAGTVVKDEREKIGRNDPCWCGSGKKYKKCHGA